MKPYYQDDYVTLYNGDCREIIPQLDTKFDLLLTDPPYGINTDTKMQKEKNTKYGAAKSARRDYGFSHWDNKPVEQKFIDFLVANTTSAIIWGGNYYVLTPSSCWLIWDKLNGDTNFADCELAWTNLKKAVRKIEHLWNGMLRAGREERFHPTQKPLAVIKWCITQAPDNVKTILDPFAGSGTTGVAAKELNKKCVLIELEEKYCEIAARRLSQEVFNFEEAEHEL